MRKINYPFTIRPLEVEEGDGYLIEFTDLPGCMSDGETPEEAMSNGQDALEAKDLSQNNLIILFGVRSRSSTRRETDRGAAGSPPSLRL